MRAGRQAGVEKVLVTGASGFVGAALLPVLAGLGGELMTLGRQAPPALPVLQARHLVADILDANSLAVAFADARPDVVIHLAGASMPPRDATARRVMLALNVLGTEAVLAAAQRAGAGHVVVVGSAAQYGLMPDATNGLREEDPCRPIGLYGISKAAAGAAALDFGRDTGLPITLAVPFNVIGPGQPAHLVPATFIRQIVAASGAVRIDVGDTSAERDWIDVRDVARAIALLAAQRRSGPYNICTGRPAPVATLLETLRDISARPLEWSVDATRLRPDQPSVHFGDPSRIAEATGWRAEFGLAETLSDMLRAAGGQTREAEQRIA